MNKSANEVTGAETQKGDTEMIEYFENIVNKTAKITGSDIVDKQYEEVISFDLSDNETDELKKIVESGTLRGAKGGVKAYYKLTLLSQNKDVVDEWIVDTSHRIATSQGYFSGGEELNKWLNSIERARNISFASVFNRKPGNGYFELLKTAASAHLGEITETNFDPCIEYDLNEAEIESLRAISNIAIADAPRDTERDLSCRIHIFDKYKTELYILDIDKDGAISTNGWQIEGDEIRTFIDAVETTSGMKTKK